MGKEKRFKKVYSQDLGCTMILVDTVTGVTPLLDREDKVVVTPVSRTVKGPEL